MFSLIQFGTTAEGLAVSWIVCKAYQYGDAPICAGLNFITASVVINIVPSIEMIPVLYIIF